METEAATLGRAYAQDPELAGALPERPRLAPGLQAVPIGADSLMLVGGPRRVLFRGRSARGQLLSLLPALNGQLTLSELEACVPDGDRDSLFDALCLLHAKGLVAEPEPETQDPLALFAGRHVGHSRANRGGGAAAARLHRARLILICPPSLRALATDTLAGSGVRDIAWVDLAANGAVDLAGRDVAVLLAPPGGDAGWLERCWGDDLPVFRVALGQALEVGPLILPWRSACPRCIDRQLDPNPPAEPWGFGIALALHRFVMTWAGIANNEYFNFVHRQDLAAPEATMKKIIRRPDCSLCGGGAEGSASQVDENVAAVFRTHYRTELTPKAFFSPAFHLAHYSAKNLETSRGKAGAGTTPGAVPFRSENLANNLGPDHWLVGFAHLLELGFGYRPGQTGAFPTRWVPSGGGLDSPTPYVAIRDCGPVPDGLYRYVAEAQALEPCPSLTGGGFLFAEPGRPQAVLLVVAAHARMASKYFSSAMRLCCLDSGVSLVNTLNLARGLGLAAHFATGLDGARLLGELNQPRTMPAPVFPTYAAAFGETPSLSEDALKGARDPLAPSADYLTLDAPAAAAEARVESRRSPDDYVAALKRRRTARVFQAEGVSREKLEALLRRACDRLEGVPLREADLGLRLVVARPGQGLEAGVYAWSLATRTVRYVAPLSLPPAEYLNQNSLTEAPVLAFVTVDLASAAQEGHAGYRNALLLSGAFGGALWVATSELGLGGCMAGGLIESALRVSAGTDGYSVCPTVAFVFGHPLGGDR